MKIPNLTAGLNRFRQSHFGIFDECHTDHLLEKSRYLFGDRPWHRLWWAAKTETNLSLLSIYRFSLYMGWMTNIRRSTVLTQHCGIIDCDLPFECFLLKTITITVDHGWRPRQRPGQGLLITIKSKWSTLKRNVPFEKEYPTVITNCF